MEDVGNQTTVRCLAVYGTTQSSLQLELKLATLSGEKPARFAYHYCDHMANMIHLNSGTVDFTGMYTDLIIHPWQLNYSSTCSTLPNVLHVAQSNNTMSCIVLHAAHYYSCTTEALEIKRAVAYAYEEL